MTSNEDKIQRLKTLVDELAAAGIDAAAEAKRLAESPKGFCAANGTKIAIGDWFMWTDYVQGAPPDYGPVTKITDTQIGIVGNTGGYCWSFSTDGIPQLLRISPKPTVPGYKVLEPRDVREGDTYYGLNGEVHTAVTNARPGHPRWLLEPEPQYRPFEDAAEALPHLPNHLREKGSTRRLHWAIWTGGYALILRPVPAGDPEFEQFTSWEHMFRYYEFEDGTPCGMRV
jgi:hypothetical protein